MSTYLGYLLAGLGSGAVIASLALGLVLSHRTSGVVNFAHAAMGMYVAFAYFEFRETGELVLPFLGLPARIYLLPRPTQTTALIVAVLLAATLGLLVYLLVFRPLRQAAPLARVVASLGLLLYLQEIVRLRFPVSGAVATRHRPVLADDPIDLLGTTVTQNRLLLLLLAVVAAAVLGAVFRFTRFGLATRAAAGNEKGALLLGISPDRLGAVSWAVASVIAGIAVILIEPIAGISATTTPLLVIPALAAALLGGLESFAITTAAGVAIGMVQSLILGWAVRPDTTWLPDWLPTTGIQQFVPVLVIIAVLVWRGDALPDRAAVSGRRLPPAPEPRNVLAWTVVLVGGAATMLATAGTELRHALIISLAFSLLTLSVVVVTGFSGQISLAQLAFAGVAGFASIRLTEHQVPFPVALVLAATLATLIGVIVGYPATRVRGMSLAIATLAMAVAIEELVLASPPFSGGHAGAAAPRPFLLGLDVGVGATGSDNFRPAFGYVCLGVLTLAALGVVNLRRNRTGLRWLAVRANERAAAAAGIDVTRAKLGAFAVSSFLAGLCGVLMAFSVTTLSPTSFLVIGALVAVALTYLAGVSSVGGALLAGALAQAGIVTTLLSSKGGGDADTYVFAISGIALILTAIFAPEGITGLVRDRVASLRHAAHRAGDQSPTSAVARVEGGPA
ncbi:MAG: ABC transporter permease [Acidimicrobiales bacterium]|nr:ABC transporter permease [Acidimicrobiales bacterium]HRW38368.1 ABC transporter permease [Aquihabitans sp.]